MIAFLVALLSALPAREAAVDPAARTDAADGPLRMDNFLKRTLSSRAFFWPVLQLLHRAKKSGSQEDCDGVQAVAELRQSFGRLLVSSDPPFKDYPVLIESLLASWQRAYRWSDEQHAQVKATLEANVYLAMVISSVQSRLRLPADLKDVGTGMDGISDWLCGRHALLVAVKRAILEDEGLRVRQYPILAQSMQMALNGLQAVKNDCVQVLRLRVEGDGLAELTSRLRQFVLDLALHSIPMWPESRSVTGSEDLLVPVLGDKAADELVRDDHHFPRRIMEARFSQPDPWQRTLHDDAMHRWASINYQNTAVLQTLKSHLRRAGRYNCRRVFIIKAARPALSMRPVPLPLAFVPRNDESSLPSVDWLALVFAGSQRLACMFHAVLSYSAALGDVGDATALAPRESSRRFAPTRHEAPNYFACMEQLRRAYVQSFRDSPSSVVLADSPEMAVWHAWLNVATMAVLYELPMLRILDSLSSSMVDVIQAEVAFFNQVVLAVRCPSYQVAYLAYIRAGLACVYRLNSRMATLLERSIVVMP